MMLAGVGCGGGTGCACGAEGAGVPFEAAAPAASPVSVLGGAATFTFPSLNPASCKLRLALPSGCPTKLGITNACGSGAAVTRKLIFGAVTCVSFAVGLCAST